MSYSQDESQYPHTLFDPMHSAQLQSAKYLQNAEGQIEFNEYTEKPKSRFKKRCGFIFRATLILGIAASVYWFYKNQDPILTNIRNNSGDYELFFENVKQHFSKSRT